MFQILDISRFYFIPYIHLYFRCREWFDIRSSNHTVLDTTLYNKVLYWLAADRRISLETPVSSINKADRHDIDVDDGVKHQNPIL
jgi:hypothetical protein